MMEAMIGDLARISGVSVTSRTSVMRYKETTKTTREIARELGVDGVVEASFTRAGNQVVITATLIDCKTDRRMWSQRYEREMQDVLAMQSQVAGESRRRSARRSRRRRRNISTKHALSIPGLTMPTSADAMS